MNASKKDMDKIVQRVGGKITAKQPTPMPTDPKFGTTNYGAHAFNPACNTMGGSAHSHWCALFYHKGVFIGYDNYRWTVRVSADPTAIWAKGCQNSAAYSNPYPSSGTTRLLHWSECPESVRQAAIPIVEEAIQICNERIAEYVESKRVIAEMKQHSMNREQRTIEEAWII